MVDHDLRRVGPALGLSILLCLAGVLGMGVYPSLFVEQTQEASTAFYESPEGTEATTDADAVEGDSGNEIRIEIGPPSQP